MFTGSVRPCYAAVPGIEPGYKPLASQASLTRPGRGAGRAAPLLVRAALLLGFT